MSNSLLGQWKSSGLKPKDDSNILVSWKDQDNKWKGPYISYYSLDEDKFFSIDGFHSSPIDIDIWIEFPEFPGVWGKDD